MKNFVLRVITAIVYVATIFVALFTNLPLFYLIFGCVMLFSLNEFYKNLSYRGITIDYVMANALAMCVYVCPIVGLYSTRFSAVPAIVAFTLALFCIELFRDNESPFHRIAFGLCGIVYVCIPFTLLAYYKTNCVLSVGGNGSDFASYMILSMFAFTWVNDTFAYFTGMLLGKHPLCPKISPKKTIEGLIGGAVVTLIAAAFVAYTWMKGEEFMYIGLAAIIIVSSTLGDMVESRFKRYVGVKDSGKMLPGHGGFLDRFDSVIFSIPVFYAYLQLFN